MLDQLSEVEADSTSAPKQAARSGAADVSVRHIAYEELESYVAGRLPAARLTYCQTHLESCEACRAELEDLRTFKSELAGFARAEPQGRGSARRKKRNGATLPQMVVVGTIIMAGTAAGFWWAHSKSRVTTATVAAANSQLAVSSTPSAAAGTATAPPVSTSARAQGASLVSAASHGPTAPTVSAAARAPTASPAPAAAQVAAAPPPTTVPRVAAAQPMSAGRAPAASAPSAAAPAATEPNTDFVLIGPLGETTTDTRPEFRWTPLPGARHYSVAIVDERLHAVQRSHALRTTSWRPRRPLRPGKTYLWQVTATLRGGTTVVASKPSPSQAVLQITRK